MKKTSIPTSTNSDGEIQGQIEKHRRLLNEAGKDLAAATGTMEREKAKRDIENISGNIIFLQGQLADRREGGISKAELLREKEELERMVETQKNELQQERDLADNYKKELKKTQATLEEKLRNLFQQEEEFRSKEEQFQKKITEERKELEDQLEKSQRDSERREAQLRKEFQKQDQLLQERENEFRRSEQSVVEHKTQIEELKRERYALEQDNLRQTRELEKKFAQERKRLTKNLRELEGRDASKSTELVQLSDVISVLKQEISELEEEHSAKSQELQSTESDASHTKLLFDLAVENLNGREVELLELEAKLRRRKRHNRFATILLSLFAGTVAFGYLEGPEIVNDFPKVVWFKYEQQLDKATTQEDWESVIRLATEIHSRFKNPENFVDPETQILDGTRASKFSRFYATKRPTLLERSNTALTEIANMIEQGEGSFGNEEELMLNLAKMQEWNLGAQRNVVITSILLPHYLRNSDYELGIRTLVNYTNDNQGVKFEFTAINDWAQTLFEEIRSEILRNSAIDQPSEILEAVVRVDGKEFECEQVVIDVISLLRILKSSGSARLHLVVEFVKENENLEGVEGFANRELSSSASLPTNELIAIAKELAKTIDLHHSSLDYLVPTLGDLLGTLNRDLSPIEYIGTVNELLQKHPIFRRYFRQSIDDNVAKVTREVLKENFSYFLGLGERWNSATTFRCLASKVSLPNKQKMELYCKAAELGDTHSEAHCLYYRVANDPQDLKSYEKLLKLREEGEQLAAFFLSCHEYFQIQSTLNQFLQTGAASDTAVRRLVTALEEAIRIAKESTRDVPEANLHVAQCLYEKGNLLKPIDVAEAQLAFNESLKYAKAYEQLPEKMEILRVSNEVYWFQYKLHKEQSNSHESIQALKSGADANNPYCLWYLGLLQFAESSELPVELRGQAVGKANLLDAAKMGLEEAKVTLRKVESELHRTDPRWFRENRKHWVR